MYWYQLLYKGLGIFVTARHVIADEISENKLVFIVQSLGDGRIVSRMVKSLCVHPFADIALGQVRPVLGTMTARPVDFEVS